VQQRLAATVNRKLAALRKFFVWAKGSGRISELPTEAVKGVPMGARVPKALPKREVNRLLRAAERDGNKRNRITSRWAGFGLIAPSGKDCSARSSSSMFILVLARQRDFSIIAGLARGKRCSQSPCPPQKSAGAAVQQAIAIVTEVSLSY
jgi:integrase